MAKEDDEQAVAEVAEIIKRYLDTYPNAADSIEGIARWWLGRQRFEERLKAVEQALEYLVAKGEVARTVAADGKAIYSRAPGKC